MPESKPSRPSESAKSDLEKIGNPAKRASAVEERELQRRKADKSQEFKPVPAWYKVMMFGLMILGLLWIVTFYVASMVQVEIPVPGIGNANIFIGFGISLVGFIMMMGWRD